MLRWSYIAFLFRRHVQSYLGASACKTVRACVQSTMRVCNTAATIQARPSVPSLFPVEAVYAVLPAVPEVRGLRSTLCWSGLRFSSLPPFGRWCLQCACLRRAAGDAGEPLLALEALQVVASCGLCIVLRCPLHVSDSDLWGRANMIECLNAWELGGLIGVL